MQSESGINNTLLQQVAETYKNAHILCIAHVYMDFKNFYLFFFDSMIWFVFYLLWIFIVFIISQCLLLILFHFIYYIFEFYYFLYVNILVLIIVSFQWVVFENSTVIVLIQSLYHDLHIVIFVLNICKFPFISIMGLLSLWNVFYHFLLMFGNSYLLFVACVAKSDILKCF